MFRSVHRSQGLSWRPASSRPLVVLVAAGVVSLGLPLGLGIGATDAAAASSPAPKLAIDWTVDASTHLAKLNQTVTVPPGTFKGTINLVTGHLKGHLTLPPATATVAPLGLVPVAQATFQIAETRPITGHVDFSNFHVKATASFDIKVVRATPAALPGLNLVGDQCTTSSPVTVTMAGTANLTGASTFSSTYTIPPLAHCGAATLALNAVVAGGGNTFTATFAPSTG